MARTAHADAADEAGALPHFYSETACALHSLGDGGLVIVALDSLSRPFAVPVLFPSIYPENRHACSIQRQRPGPTTVGLSTWQKRPRLNSVPAFGAGAPVRAMRRSVSVP